MNKKGFTLLEMLIVIAIVTLLAAVATTSYSLATLKSRDARRYSDLNQIQNAMETYYSTCNFVYPTMSGSTKISCGSTDILSTLPSDPKGGSGYSYTFSTSTSSTYTLCGKLESGAAPTICLSNKQ